MRGRLAVEQRQLGRLHDVGADVALGGLHEQEHLDVAEEGQTQRQAAEARHAGVAAERRDGLWKVLLVIGMFRSLVRVPAGVMPERKLLGVKC